MMTELIGEVKSSLDYGLDQGRWDRRPAGLGQARRLSHLAATKRRNSLRRSAEAGGFAFFAFRDGRGRGRLDADHIPVGLVSCPELGRVNCLGGLEGDEDVEVV